MKTFNLSRWALEHKSFVVYLMLVVTLAGIFAYRQLGRDEDPPFTIKTMVVKTLWPGATTLETMRQITDRIEKKLEELPNLDYARSYTKPGESVVFVYLKDSTPASDVPDLWYQVRKKMDDIRHTLPSGVNGPFFNDEFGDTYSLGMIAQFPVGKAIRRKGVDQCISIAEFVVEERALHTLRQGVLDVADLLAHLVPEIGHFRGWG